MRFIKDLMTWKQQAASEIEEIRPLTRQLGPGSTQRQNAAAQETDDEAYDDDDEFEDELEDDATGNDGDELFDDEFDEDEDDDDDEDDLPPPRPAPLTRTAAPGALPVPPARAAAPAATEGETYDLLSRVVRNAAPPPKPEAPLPRVAQTAPRPVHTAPRPAQAAQTAPRPPVMPEPRPAMPMPPDPRLSVPPVPGPRAMPATPDAPPAPRPQPAVAGLPQPPAPLPAAPAPVARQARIWDIPTGAPARRPENALPAEPTVPLPAVPRAVPPVQADAAGAPAPAPAAAPAPRAKTRLLGFHHPGMDAADPLGAPVARPREAVTFPTGWLVVIEGPGRGASFTLAEGVNQVGRGEDQSVRLDFGDTAISRSNHASLAFDPESGKFFLGHGGKSNIVRLNGRPVLSTEELASNDVIKIGETVMRFVGFCDRDFSWDQGKAGFPDAQAG
jgi:hypothetical protein